MRDTRLGHQFGARPGCIECAAQARGDVNGQDVGVGGSQLPIEFGKLSRRGLRCDGQAVGGCQQAVELVGLDVDSLAIGLVVQGHDQGHRVDVEFCRLCGDKHTSVPLSVTICISFSFAWVPVGVLEPVQQAQGRGLGGIDQQRGVLVGKVAPAALVRDHGAAVVGVFGAYRGAGRTNHIEGKASGLAVGF